MPSLQLEHLTKTFPTRDGQVRAVDDLNLGVAEGELLVLLGPSGSGKTTTLRLVAGLEEPTAGVIRIGDCIVNRLAPKDRDVAMVFQNYALYPHMTVYGNLAFGLKMRRTPRAEIDRRVREAAEMIGISSLLDRKPATLSGGEKQRVALGRAVVRCPNVFLLDEPLANIDLPRRTATRTEIKSLQRRLGVTTLYVTHDQEEAMTLGDRIAVLDRGTIVQCAPPEEVYRRPANRTVAAFVGSPPMNFFEARLVADGPSLAVQCAWGRFPVLGNRVPPGPDPVHPDCAAVVNVRGPAELHAAILGIRPEDIRIAGSAAQGCESSRHPASNWPPAHGDFRVELVEPLGSSTIVHVAGPGATRAVLRIPPDRAPAVGAMVKLEVNAAAVHLFSADPAGRRLK
jgi:multiple sugar transport system ATP-binding protein